MKRVQDVGSAAGPVQSVDVAVWMRVDAEVPTADGHLRDQHLDAAAAVEVPRRSDAVHREQGPGIDLHCGPGRRRVHRRKERVQHSFRTFREQHGDDVEPPVAVHVENRQLLVIVERRRRRMGHRRPHRRVRIACPGARASWIAIPGASGNHVQMPVTIDICDGAPHCVSVRLDQSRRPGAGRIGGRAQNHDLLVDLVVAHRLGHAAVSVQIPEQEIVAVGDARQDVSHPGATRILEPHLGPRQVRAGDLARDDIAPPVPVEVAHKETRTLAVTTSFRKRSRRRCRDEVGRPHSVDAAGVLIPGHVGEPGNNDIRPAVPIDVAYRRQLRHLVVDPQRNRMAHKRRRRRTVSCDRQG